MSMILVNSIGLNKLDLIVNWLVMINLVDISEPFCNDTINWEGMPLGHNKWITIINVKVDLLYLII